MGNYQAFRAVFKTTSDKSLNATIINSQRRFDAADLDGNDAAAAVEIDRIQAAVDELDARGAYGKSTNTQPSGQLAAQKAGVEPSGMSNKTRALIGALLLAAVML